MPRLIACPSCSAHVHRIADGCPHCGAAVRDASGSVGRTAGAILMGLSLSGCPGDGGGPTPEPEYGVPATESNSGEPTEDSGGTSSTGAEESTGGSNDTDETISVGEPEYGVPETESVGEPDYGVPETSGA